MASSPVLRRDCDEDDAMGLVTVIVCFSCDMRGI
jgi:hypothetical protein